MKKELQKRIQMENIASMLAELIVANIKERQEKRKHRRVRRTSSKRIKR